MSSVSSVYDSSSTLSLVDLLQQAQEEANASSSVFDSITSSSTSGSSSASSRKAQNAYGGASAGSALGQAAINKALAEMGSSYGNKVTFSDIAAHREDLETAFTAQVRLDLAELGVDLDTEFSLTMNSDGTISVSCDDPNAKSAIQQYLSDNPEVCEQFGYIQALSNLEKARSSPAASTAMWQEVRSNTVAMQTAALEEFFSDASSSGFNYTSILADFGSGSGSDSASFYTGVNYTV